MESLSTLIIIALFVSLVTVVGHLLWLFFAALGRVLIGSRRISSGQSISSDSNPRIGDDLMAAGRLLDYATYKGWLKEAQIDSLKQLLSAFSERHTAEQRKEIGVGAPAGADLPASASVATSPWAEQLPPQPNQPLQALPGERLVPVGTQAAIPSLRTRQVQAVHTVRTEPKPLPAKPAAQSSSHPLDSVDIDGAKPLTPSTVVPKIQKSAKQLGADLLRAFMEKSNIRWIEIVSAALIVVCSVGLVISLWNTLSASSRFFPSLVFLLATIAVHGAGQYTLRQWNLRSTSRGILHIGLMLIPLAVLVGILLSRRTEQEPQLDLGTLAVLAIGTAVYGALAVTASRALFSGRWFPVASAVMIGSLTLVPIHLLASQEQLLRPLAVLAIAPLVLVSLINVLQLSSLTSLPVLTTGRMRRIASQVLQIIFAALVPCTFWVMQSKGIGLSKASVATAGILIAGWASWGWAASLKRLLAGCESDRADLRRGLISSGLSWYVVVAWSLAGVCSLALAAIVWQVIDDRAMLVVSLLGLAAWWYTHGWHCGLTTSLLAASISLIVSLGLFLEGVFPEAQSHLLMSDWLSLPRVGMLNGLSLIVGMAGLAMTKSFRQYSGLQKIVLTAGGHKASLPKLAVAMMAGAALVLLGTAGLTTLASLTRFSQPAYGGNWAPALLLGYGGGLLAAGIWQTQSNALSAITNSLAQHLLKAMLPMGQAVLLLATFRLCLSAPWIPQWLVDLRPIGAWAIGAGGLAVIWSALAATLRWTADSSPSADSSTSSHRWKHQTNVQWLSVAAIVLACASSVMFWTRGDKLLLASSAGWVLPAVLTFSFFALRKVFLREYALLATSGWLVSLVISIGWHQHWWSDLGLAATVSILTVVQLGVLTLYWFLIGRKPQQEMLWWQKGFHWANALLINLWWLSTLAVTALPLTWQLYSNLNGDLLNEKSFVLASFAPVRSILVAIALIGLGLFTFASRSLANPIQSPWMFQLHWLATLPMALAGLVGCQMTAPYGLPALLWILSIVLILLELLPVTNSSWGRQLAELNQFSTGSKSVFRLPGFWLYTTRIVSQTFLWVISAGVLSTLWWRGLPEPLSPLLSNMDSWTGWISNLLRVSSWSGPLLAVCAVRWLYSLCSAAPSSWVVSRGFSLGIFATVVCTFAGARDLTTAALFGAQSLSMIMLLISAKTIAFTTVRNWLGLQHLNSGNSAWQVLIKACRGARWRESHKASGQLWLGAIAPAAVLCMLAGGLVAYYPCEPRGELHRIGGFWSISTLVLSLGQWWLLGIERDLPKLARLAITLSLLTPVIAAGYASWLMSNSGNTIASAGGFEPYRLQIGLWLASLGIILVSQVHNLLHAKVTTRPVEAFWVVLAAIVALLAIFGLSDSTWASVQLGLLAVIITISGEVSGQTVRGYIAALLGMLAWAAWCLDSVQELDAFMAWQTLLAPVVIGMLSLMVRYVIHWKQIEVRPQLSWTIDRAVVLVIPIFSAIMSGWWALLMPGEPSSPVWIVAGVWGLAWLTFMLAVARLFQPQPGQRGLGVYVAAIAFALVSVEFACWQFGISRVYKNLAWWSSLLGTMAVLAGLLREIVLQRTPIQHWLQSRNLIQSSKLASTTSWMAVWHTLAALFCLIPSVWLVLYMSQEGLRMAAIALPLLGALAILPLTFEKLRSVQQGCVLLLVSVTLVLAWWADLPSAWALREPYQSWLFVQRAFLAFVFLSLSYLLVAYFRKTDDQWTGTLSKAGWICLVVALSLGGGMVLVSAMGHWSDYPSRVSLLAKLMTCLGWSAIFVRLIQFAAWPQGWDRFANPSLRTVAVYAAEIVIAVWCASTYYQFPDLFSRGLFLNWWPVILFAIAFASTLLGEWLKQIQLPLLADPIRRSSLLLPIIPLAGVWAIQSDRTAMLWSDFERFAVLLLIASSLYGLHGWMRGSVALRGLSACLVLLGFWSFLHSNPDMRFFEHPQFWLMPPAICSLIFIEWNRSRLDETVVTAVRYLSILVAYLSSTSEIFFRSFEGNLWPPIFLSFWAVSGIMAGIVLRVRAFLFCGLVFVAIGLFGMVWHAAQAIEQVWPWWAFGIATGVSLIFMLGYFEKNRPRIINYLEELKSWQS